MRKIYIDLDGLMDTRLGLVSVLNPEAAVQVTQSSAYWDRDYTNWTNLTNNYLDQAIFDTAWKERTTDTLKESVVSGIMAVLGRVITEYQHNVTEGMSKDDIAVEINIAPYELDDDEMDELTDILRESIYHDLPVFFISRPIDELTPAFIKANYDALILYEFHLWVRVHHMALVETNCRDTTFIIPRLFEKDPLKLSDEQKRDEFIAFRLGFLDHMELEFIDAEWFSMYRPLNKEP